MSRGIAALTRAVLLTPLFMLSRPAKVVLEVRRNSPMEMVQKAVEEILGERRGRSDTAQGFRWRVHDVLVDRRSLVTASTSTGRWPALPTRTSSGSSGSRKWR